MENSRIEYQLEYAVWEMTDVNIVVLHVRNRIWMK